MLIFMLAAAMMLAMLIATAFGLMNEAGQADLRERLRGGNPYKLR